MGGKDTTVARSGRWLSVSLLALPIGWGRTGLIQADREIGAEAGTGGDLADVARRLRPPRAPVAHPANQATAVSRWIDLWSGSISLEGEEVAGVRVSPHACASAGKSLIVVERWPYGGGLLFKRILPSVLSPVESDRLYRLAYVTHVASAALGGVEPARQWLARGNRSLGGVPPMGLLDTDTG